MSNARRSARKLELMALPNDILQMVADLLPNKDVKSVRLVDRRFKANALLRISRVYISPNSKNLDVFNSIAASTEFRGQVKEIVWDDALLPNWNFLNDEYDKLGSQAWQRECGAFADDCMNAEADPNYALYRQLYKEQQDIIVAGTDAQALRDALPLFNSLERVTVTPTTYQPRLACPRYYTPMIRSFPPSFKFPLPMGWATRTDEEEPDEQDLSWEEIKEPWHGLCIVLRELARCDRAVPELVCDVNRQLTGIAWQLFQESPENCEDLRNFETICSRGLTRLDLAIHVVNGQDMPGLSMLSTRSLRAILEKANGMESFSLHTNANVLLEVDEVLDEDFLGDGIRALDVVPLQNWPRLRHLALSHLYVDSEKMVDFLGQLPTTLETLELVAVTTHPDPSWRRTFDSIKDTLGWTGNKPVITFADEDFCMPWMKHWAKESVISSFLKGEGVNPFDEFGACLEEMSTTLFDNPERCN